MSARLLRADVLHRVCVASVSAFLLLFVLRVALGHVAAADEVVEAVDASPASGVLVTVLLVLILVTAAAWVGFLAVELALRRRGRRRG